MIHIEQHQPLKDDPKTLVAVPTGDYDETDLLECYAEGADPAVPTCMYQAQYVVLGRPIYEQSEELTEDQVAALLANRPAHEVINNRKLIDGKKRASKYVGRVVGARGVKALKRDQRKKALADEASATSTPTFSDPVEVIEPKIERPVDGSATTTPDLIEESVSEGAAAVPVAGTTTEPFTTSAPASDPVSTTTEPVTEVPVTDGDQATSSAESVPALEMSTTTLEAIPMATSTPLSTPTSTTTEEIVAYAKRKIIKKLGL